MHRLIVSARQLALNVTSERHSPRLANSDAFSMSVTSNSEPSGNKRLTDHARQQVKTRRCWGADRSNRNIALFKARKTGAARSG